MSLRFANTLLTLCLLSTAPAWAVDPSPTRTSLEARCNELMAAHPHLRGVNELAKQESFSSGYVSIPAHIIESLDLNELQIVLNQNVRELSQLVSSDKLDVNTYLATLHFDAEALHTWSAAHRLENRAEFDAFALKHGQTMKSLNTVFVRLLSVRSAPLTSETITELLLICRIYAETLPLDQAIELGELILSHEALHHALGELESTTLRREILSMRIHLVRERPGDRALGLLLVQEFDKLRASQNWEPIALQLQILQYIDAAVGAIPEGKLSREQVLLIKDLAARLPREMREFNSRVELTFNRAAPFLLVHGAQLRDVEPGLFTLLDHAAGYRLDDIPKVLN